MNDSVGRCLFKILIQRSFCTVYRSFSLVRRVVNFLGCPAASVTRYSRNGWTRDRVCGRSSLSELKSQGKGVNENRGNKDGVITTKGGNKYRQVNQRDFMGSGSNNKPRRWNFVIENTRIALPLTG